MDPEFFLSPKRLSSAEYREIKGTASAYHLRQFLFDIDYLVSAF